MCVRRLLALLSANSSVLMSFSLDRYLFTCSQMIISTQLKHKSTVLKTEFGSSVMHVYEHTAEVLRCGLANVLYTLQRVNAVRTSQDTRSEHNGQSISTHPVCFLLQ